MKVSTLTCALAFVLAAAAPSEAALPEGRAGIAAQYPGDRGIQRDPDVIFVENFNDASMQALKQRWDTLGVPGTLSFSSIVPEPGSGEASICITHIGGKGTGGKLYRRLLPGYDQLFARWYVRFDRDCFPVHHFGTHLGGFGPPTPWPQGGAGELPEGDKRFTSGVEPFGKNWTWDFYSYWQGMHVHGDGRYWGTPFLVGGSHPKVEHDRWISVEMMLRLNDPPESANGEQAFWIDGALWRRDGQVVSHIGPGFPKGRWTGGWWQPEAAAQTAFEGFRWRSVPDLKINYLWTYLYITDAPKGHVSKVWFDNIVVARKYIGPIAEIGDSRQL